MSAPTTSDCNQDAARAHGSSLQRLVGRHSWCVLHHADCRDVLPLEADAVVTDPPYGSNYASNPVVWRNARKHTETPNEWDKEPGDVAILMNAPIIVIWGGNYFPLPPSRGWLVWRKLGAPPSMADCELAWTNLDQNTKQIEYSIKRASLEGVGHPTQKPVRVMAWAMEQAKIPVGATVLDPYMGSGSIGIACLRTGRNYIGIERDAAHYKTACDRIARELDGALL